MVVQLQGLGHARGVYLPAGRARAARVAPGEGQVVARQAFREGAAWAGGQAPGDGEAHVGALALEDDLGGERRE